MLNGNRDFYDVPRKFKITITGCRAWCSHPEINDVEMTPVRHPATGAVGFAVRVGGGLSTQPHLDDVYRDHVGVHPQRQAGYVYVGAPTRSSARCWPAPRGRGRPRRAPRPHAPRRGRPESRRALVPADV
jgi:sulfite reductase beta subunit-like hemoprotein